MTKATAIYQFWAGFGIPTYEENAVPTGEDAPAFPYITYSLTTDSFGNEVAMSASVWYRSTSWTECNAKAEEISATIGMGGKTIPIDSGIIWIKRGQPFAQNMGDENDDMIRRKYINISVEYLTIN